MELKVNVNQIIDTVGDLAFAPDTPTKRGGAAKTMRFRVQTDPGKLPRVVMTKGFTAAATRIAIESALNAQLAKQGIDKDDLPVPGRDEL